MSASAVTSDADDARAAGGRAPVIGMVSLGCPKALVDSERILTRLRAEGYAFSPSYDGADLVIVNTCGFLDSARDESLAAIGEALDKNGRVIVTGCLGAEPEVIEAAHPSVLAVTGPHQYEQVVAAVHEALPPARDPRFDLIPPQGIKLTPRHTAYLKIAEGCDNRCSFCIIPQLRGDLVSRPARAVLTEAERLVDAGVRELLVVSQDTAAYGRDVRYAESEWRGSPRKAKFFDLCDALGELGAWVRLHYVYPYPHVDAVVELMATGAVLPYLDIPFQHASPTVLRAMRRPANDAKMLDRIAAWRRTSPDLAIRSTFIVGFPGETEADFAHLLEWLREAKIDRAGFFQYEDVKGAPSHDLPDHVPAAVKQERYDRAMAVQAEIAAARGKRMVGKRIDVMVDSAADGAVIGRSKADAPEIDGVVRVSGARRVKPGDVIKARVTAASGYDLEAAVGR